jgi:putative transposase
MRTWPHAPSKRVKGPGLYCITAGTYEKRLLFDSPAKLDMLRESLFEIAGEQGWQLEAWALFANHYHIVGQAPKTDDPVRGLTSILHGRTSRALNKLEGVTGRKVWWNCWDTLLTYEKSYMARLAYVHTNPVKHGLVRLAKDYEWCSSAWFEQNGERPFVSSVLSFPTDRVKMYDDFDLAETALKES